MQITHETNSPDEFLVGFPLELPVKDVNVYIHDSGMVANHDYSCPVCRERHAILDLSTGLMQPCSLCRKDYTLIKVDKRKWWQKFMVVVKATIRQLTLLITGAAAPQLREKPFD